MSTPIWNCTQTFTVGENCEFSYAEYLGVTYTIVSSLMLVCNVCLLLYSGYFLILCIRKIGSSFFSSLLETLPRLALVTCFLVSLLLLIPFADFEGYRRLIPVEATTFFFHLCSNVVAALGFYALRLYLSILKRSLIGKGKITGVLLSIPYIIAFCIVLGLSILITILVISVPKNVHILKAIHAIVYNSMLLFLMSLSIHCCVLLHNYKKKVNEDSAILGNTVRTRQDSVNNALEKRNLDSLNASSNIVDDDRKVSQTEVPSKNHEVNVSSDTVLDNENEQRYQHSEISVNGAESQDLEAVSTPQMTAVSKSKKQSKHNPKKGFEKRYRKGVIMNSVSAVLVITLCLANFYSVYILLRDKEGLYSYNDPPSGFGLWVSSVPNFALVGVCFILLYYFNKYV